jgi:hypothetical protein
MMVQAIGASCVLLLYVCMSMVSEVVIFEQVVHLGIVLSSRCCIVILGQVNEAVVVIACLLYLHFIITLIESR